MPVFSYRPQSILSNYIDVLWSHEEMVSEHSRECVLPTGTVTLIIDFKNRNACLLGAHSQYFVLDTSQKTSFIGVHFLPGGAAPFFRLPIGELQNQILPLDLLWGSQVYHLRDRLLETPDPYTRFRLLERQLFDLARDSLIEQPALTYAVRAMQSTTHTRAISEIAEQTGLRHSKFIQAFQHTVGLTPKVFHRICRFQAALSQIASGQPISWVDLALNSGYFDQAHFIHDFQSFSGFTPSGYLSHRSLGLNHNHVPLIESDQDTGENFLQ